MLIPELGGTDILSSIPGSVSANTDSVRKGLVIIRAVILKMGEREQPILVQ